MNPTHDADNLAKALEKLNMHVIRELYDGHKHIDLALPVGRINIEVDGNQHYDTAKQILSDLKRAHYSDRLGYDTIHIPNSIIQKEVDNVAVALAEAAHTRERQLREKFHAHYRDDSILHGIIVENSLKDKSILDHLHVHIYRSWKDGDWILHEVGITDKAAEELPNYLDDGHWYIHLWKKGNSETIVIFKDKKFHIDQFDKSTWKDVVQYGTSIGIPVEQLDFLRHEEK